MSWLLHHSIVLGDKWLQKEAKTENKMEDKIQLQTPRWFVDCRHFNLCACDQHEYN